MTNNITRGALLIEGPAAPAPAPVVRFLAPAPAAPAPVSRPLSPVVVLR